MEVIVDKINSHSDSSLSWYETDSGLRYYFLRKAGAGGSRPVASSNVEVNYEGKLLNKQGEWQIFDSSYKRGESISFPLNGVIAGWTEMLQLMEVGDKVEVVIPSELAYGSYGAPGVIGPNEDLVFVIELLNFS